MQAVIKYAWKYRETALLWNIAADIFCIAGQKYVMKDTWNWIKYTTVQIILERFNTKTTYISHKICASRHNMSKETITRICCVNWCHKHFVPWVWAFLEKAVLPYKAVLLLYCVSSHLEGGVLTSNNGCTVEKVLTSHWHNCYTAHRPSSDCIREMTLLVWPSRNPFCWCNVKCTWGMMVSQPCRCIPHL